jgi:hypothetical protein
MHNGNLRVTSFLKGERGFELVTSASLGVVHNRLSYLLRMNHIILEGKQHTRKIYTITLINAGLKRDFQSFITEEGNLLDPTRFCEVYHDI